MNPVPSFIAYRLLCRLLGPIFEMKRNVRKMWRKISEDQSIPLHDVWHVASVGEWELLRPVLERELSEGHGNSRLALTYFSGSVEKSIRAWVLALPAEQMQRISVVCPSPNEGDWKLFFDKFGYPKRWITVRYEAWPEVWMLAAQRRFSIWILGAQAQGALLIAKKILRIFGIALPDLRFSVFSAADAGELRSAFPHAKVVALRDPRWDRILARVEHHDRRESTLWKRHPDQSPQSESRDASPILILGSIWPEDLQWWVEALSEPIAGLRTIWIVPHQIDPQFVAKCENVWKTLPSAAVDRVHVRWWNELGVLTELYQWGDVAYVGGGRNHGVHSTMEPAVAGVPIACAPYRSARFTEIAELEKQGQLTLVSSAGDLRSWIVHAVEQQLLKRVEWKNETAEHRGGAQSHFDWLRESP